MKLTIDKLCKSYVKGINVLDELSIELTEGVYGLLGPNGAGKSTLINILTDNLGATSGAVYLDGAEISKMNKEYRKLLGYMPQQQGIYPNFTLERFMYYMASLKGIDKKSAKDQIEKYIGLVNLNNDKKKKLGSFSGGMKQRALIAQALLGSPKIIILDEPTAGLDPKERIRIRNLISEIAFDKIVIIATHVVSDVDSIAKDVILLKKGKILKTASPKNLCEELRGKVFEFVCDEEKWNEISTDLCVSNMAKYGDGLHVRVISENGTMPGWNEVMPSLEDVYLYYFKEESIYNNV